MSEVIRLSEEEVLRIRRRLASIDLAKQSTFGGAEPAYPDRLASAVARQWTSNGTAYKYRRLAEVAGTLFYGVAMSHAFENGNKRTAMMALFVQLDRNRNILINTSEQDLYSFAEQVADHRLALPNGMNRDSDSEVIAVSRWIRARIQPIPTGDRHMRFTELKSTLEALGCTFDGPDKNYVKIHRGSASVSLGYPKQDYDVAVNEIKRVRKHLSLDAGHGVDARGFYDFESSVDRFVEKHTELMKRLADL